MLGGAKRRAEAAGVPFSLTMQDLRELVTETCPALGVPLQWGYKGGHGKRPDSPSLDRVIPALGYVPGNVVIVSDLANQIKSNATADQILRVGEWLAGVERARILRVA
jgi:hypothetical protein